MKSQETESRWAELEDLYRFPGWRETGGQLGIPLVSGAGTHVTSFVSSGHHRDTGTRSFHTSCPRWSNPSRSPASLCQDTWSRCCCWVVPGCPFKMHLAPFSFKTGFLFCFSNAGNLRQHFFFYLKLPTHSSLLWIWKQNMLQALTSVAHSQIELHSRDKGDRPYLGPGYMVWSLLWKVCVCRTFPGSEIMQVELEDGALALHTHVEL